MGVLTVIEKEVWKVYDKNRNYKISNQGRVKSSRRNIILKPFLTHNGYLRVKIPIDGKARNRFVHRLVAETFIVNQDNKPMVNHKDFDKMNNHASNLEWVTNSENVQHADRLRRRNKPRKLTKKEVLEIRASDLPQYKLATKYCVSRTAISKIILRQRWAHI